MPQFRACASPALNQPTTCKSMRATMSIPVTVASGSPNLQKAFHNWNPAVLTAGDPENYIATTYTYTGYDAFDTTSTYGPLPAPDNFATQTDVTGIAYVGDKWSRKYGVVSNATNDWGVTNAGRRETMRCTNSGST